MSLQHPLLRACGVSHGFGTRDARPPVRLVRPRQVHGARAVAAAACAADSEADAVVAVAGDPGIAVVTADCVPLLVARADGAAVAAIHAGWRGLAAGVIEAGVDALRHAAPGGPLCAVVGPHVGACCYEVDAPVLDALRHRIAACPGAVAPAPRPDHWWLDLGALARHALQGCGLAPRAIGQLADACTACDAERFHSYRRDGPRAGRLVHWIVPRAA